MEKSKERLKILEKIDELERAERWDEDVEDDPETIELLPNEIDYLNKKLSSKIKTIYANFMGTMFFEKLIGYTWPAVAVPPRWCSPRAHVSSCSPLVPR